MINEETKQEKLDFYSLGINSKLLAILEELKFTTPTPIQFKSIPVTIDGKDIVGIAQTGTGKTLAFGIPLLQRMSEQAGKALVILPTRELAVQVNDSLGKIGYRMGIKTAVLIGGEPARKQLEALRRGPQIIIATPGRLNDHLKNKALHLDDIKILVFDEADMMFDMGFAPQIENILRTVPKERQTMLFSATMPPAIMKIIQQHMALPVRIEVAPAGTPAENVVQEMIMLKADDKFSQLEKILNEYAGSILVFSRTKHNAKKICQNIVQLGHKAVEIHSNRSLGQRREALSGFKNGRYRVLVATDIAARGIDVDGIELVLNYDLPDNTEDYVHRIGRTGRAGKFGRAISFALPSQSREIREIERLIKKNIPLSRVGMENMPASRPVSRPTSQPRSFQREAPRRYSRPTTSSRPFISKDAKPYRSEGQTSRPFNSRSNARPQQTEEQSSRPYQSRPQQSSGKFSRPTSGQSRPYQSRSQQSSSRPFEKYSSRTTEQSKPQQTTEKTPTSRQRPKPQYGLGQVNDRRRAGGFDKKRER
jgi:ATP-dependent RNA helicase RhlE